jgi:hypothetical protein
MQKPWVNAQQLESNAVKHCYFLKAVVSIVGIKYFGMSLKS